MKITINILLRIIATIVIYFSLSEYAWSVSAKELFSQIISVMQERNALWNKSNDTGGTRESDISDLVCPIVTKNDLKKISNDPNYSSSVEYNYYEDGGLIFEEKTNVWIIKRKINFLETQILMIVISDSECRAYYQHII
jgi:hypothetical protein